MNLKHLFAAMGAVASCAAFAQTPVVDGTKDASYIQLAVQNTQTQFGDSNLGMNNYANGSELDNISYYRTATDLYIFVGGNVESNYNKFELFVDTGVGGDNRLLGNYPDVDFGALNRMSDSGIGDGLIFDATFTPRYWYGLTCGGDPFGIFANFSEVKSTLDGGTGYYLGSTTNGVGVLGGGTNPNNVEATLDNLNIAGVPGGADPDPGNGASVTTGVEFKIPLSEIGNPTGAIKLCVFINGSGHDYISNQVLQGIGGGSNFGEPRNTNFESVAGNQYVVVPAPVQPVTLTPTAFNVGLGAVASGNLASLASDDANALKLCKAFVPNFTSPRIRLDATFLSPYLTATSLKLDMKARMTTGGSFKVRGFLADTSGSGTFAYGAPNQVIADTSIALTFAAYSSGAVAATNHIDNDADATADGTIVARTEIQQTGFSAVAVPCAEWELINVTVTP